MNPRPDNLISWIAASVAVTAGVLFVLKRQEDQGKPTSVRVLPRATPAQESVGLQRDNPRTGKHRPFWGSLRPAARATE
jgi:hypothetical protein